MKNNELKQKIDDNLEYMYDLLDLMNVENYQDSEEIDNKFNEIFEKTKELSGCL